MEKGCKREIEMQKEIRKVKKTRKEKNENESKERLRAGPQMKRMGSKRVRKYVTKRTRRKETKE